MKTAIQFVDKQTGKEVLPRQVNIGTLIGIIDLGTQASKFLDKNGRPEAPAPQISLLFEFPHTLFGGRPYSFPFRVKFDTGRNSTLYKYAFALLGGNNTAEEALKSTIDLPSLLGKSAQLQIGDTEGGYPKIIVMLPLIGGMEHPTPSITPTLFNLDQPDVAMFQDFIPWVKEAILAAPECPAVLKSPSQATGATPMNTQHSVVSSQKPYERKAYDF